jgi:hypothetical protein
MLPLDASKIVTGEKIKAVAKIAPNLSLREEDLKITGNKIELFHKTGYEEFSANEVFDHDVSYSRIYSDLAENYCTAFIEGFNVTFLSMGSSQSEKTRLIEGSKEEDGLITSFLEDFYQKLDSKRQKYKKAGKDIYWALRFGAAEIVDENIQDLMGGPGPRIDDGDWEGPKVFGAVEHAIVSFLKFRELFKNAKLKRTRFISEFGPLIHKAACVYSIELTQVVKGDGALVCSRAMFIDMPAVDNVLEDPESIKQKEGPTLSKGIFSFKNVLISLAGISKNFSTAEQIKEQFEHPQAHSLLKGKNDGDARTVIKESRNFGPGVTFFESSQLTKLLKESLGGNSYTLAIFSLANGDYKGSLASLKLMSFIKNVVNFPVLNEGNLLGLLQKYRSEIKRARDLSSVEGSYGLKYDTRLLEDQKRLLEEDVSRIKQLEQNEKLAERLSELREKYNMLVKSKANLQSELIKSEEEKLQISKALIELQIENTKLLESLHQEQYALGNRLVGQEAEITGFQAKEQKAMEIIQELQDKLETALDDKKDLETEFVVLKKNYSSMVEDKEKLENRVEELHLELVNLSNEKKILEKEIGGIGEKNIASEKRAAVMARDYERMREDLAILKAECENLKNQANRQGLEVRKEGTELDEIEKVTFEFDQKRGLVKNRMVNLESERRELLTKNRHLLRRLELVTVSGAECQKVIEALRAENQKLATQLEETRNVYRSKLLSYAHGDIKVNYMNAREDLLRSYAEREIELLEKNEKCNQTIKSVTLELEGLKIYSEKVRELAEDWAPVGVPLPDLITQPPNLAPRLDERLKSQDVVVQSRLMKPQFNRSVQDQYDSLGNLIEKENQFYKSQTNLRQADKFLDLKKADATSQHISDHQIGRRNQAQHQSYFAVQNQADKLQYQNYLGDQGKVFGLESLAAPNDPYTGMAIDMDIAEDLCNKSREELVSEIMTLRAKIRRLQIITKTPANQLLLTLQAENEKLHSKIRLLESKPVSPQTYTNSEIEKSLQKKINFLEKIIQTSEIERSQLLTRANLADEQLKALQEKYGALVKDSQGKINQLKHQLKIYPSCHNN